MSTRTSAPSFTIQDHLTIMKIALLFFSLITALTSYSQGVRRAAIAGTRLSVQLPNNIDVAKHSPVILHDRAELIFTEMTESGMLEKFQNEFDSVGFESQGIKVIESRDLTIDNYFARLFILEPDQETHAISGYFADSTFAVMFQGRFDKKDEDVKSEVLQIIYSAKLDKSKEIVWDDFLAFDYPKSSIFKIHSNQNHNLAVYFTPQGINNPKLFERTNIMCTQFIPDEEVESAEDLMIQILAPQMAHFEILEILSDKQLTNNGTDTYCFHARCKRDEQEIQVYSVGFYHETACALAMAIIVDNEYDQEVQDFINAFKLKKDGY